jgi:mono/diheme cytochrome c family protein
VKADLLRRVALPALPLILGACSWFTDFKQQPSVGTWQEFSSDSGELKGFRGQPQNSVSTGGTLAAGYAISYSPMIATIDSFSTIQNPVAPDPRSLLNGRKYFTINCAVCHGVLADGNGTLKQLNPAYGFPPSLLADVTKNRTDGYIWGMIRNGRGLMPSANRIEETDRWDVVNYVRGLQGRYPVDTGAVGRPGETGDKLPGFTRLGPTVPAPYAHPVVIVHEPGTPRAVAPAAPAAAPTKPETKP